MKATRICINGFGRIGRLAFRAGWDRSDLEFVQINEIKGGPVVAGHLLEFDSTQGRWHRRIVVERDSIVVENRAIRFTQYSSPGKFEVNGIDLILECTGRFRTWEALKPFFQNGVPKVIVAAPVKENALNIVVGVNDDLYRPEQHHLVTAASCTTNCLAPIVKVIHEKIGIRHGVITTIHDATNTQTVADAPHSDLRRARTAALSLIPTTTGSAIAIGLIYPELLGKLNGLAVRVGLFNASLTDCVFEVARRTDVAEVNRFLKDAAETSLKGILGYEERPLVSVDFKGDPRSAIVDAPSTMVVDETQVKVLAWYDNEWGYANRLVELAAKIGRTAPIPEEGT
jgi:glyceraldehyde 3-phosphate dehydrogenase